MQKFGLKGHPLEHRCCRTKTEAKKWIQDTEAAIRDGRFMTLQETKNGERRVIPLTEEVTKILKDLFYTNFGTNKAISSNLKFTPTKNPISIRKSFARVLKVAGIENFRFHDCVILQPPTWPWVGQHKVN